MEEMYNALFHAKYYILFMVLSNKQNLIQWSVHLDVERRKAAEQKVCLTNK